MLCGCVGVDRYSGRLCMHCPCAPGRSRAVVFNLLGPMFVYLAIVVFASRSSLSFLRLSIRINQSILTAHRAAHETQDPEVPCYTHECMRGPRTAPPHALA